MPARRGCQELRRRDLVQGAAPPLSCYRSAYDLATGHRERRRACVREGDRPAPARCGAAGPPLPWLPTYVHKLQGDSKMATVPGLMGPPPPPAVVGHVCSSSAQAVAEFILPDLEELPTKTLLRRKVSVGKSPDSSSSRVQGFWGWGSVWRYLPQIFPVLARLVTVPSPEAGSSGVFFSVLPVCCEVRHHVQTMLLRLGCVPVGQSVDSLQPSIVLRRLCPLVAPRGPEGPGSTPVADGRRCKSQPRQSETSHLLRLGGDEPTKSAASHPCSCLGKSQGRRWSAAGRQAHSHDSASEKKMK